MDPAGISHPHVILLGTQRSGTTLLTRILDTHSKLFIQNEISVAQVFNSEKTKEIISNCNDQVLKRHGKSIPDLLTETNKTYWGFKDPQLTEHLDKLKPFLRKTKFITIIRDPRGVVNSYIDNKWGLGTTAYTGALRWKEEVELQKAFMALAPKQCLYIRYEDLVSELEPTLKRICTHLNIEYEPEMLDFHNKKARYKLNASNINTMKKTTTQFSSRWKASLSVRQVEDIEYVCHDLMQANNYKTVTEGTRPNVMRRLHCRLHQLIIGEIQIQYQLKRVYLKRKFPKVFSN